MRTLIVSKLQSTHWSIILLILCYMGGIVGLLSPFSQLFLITTPLILIYSAALFFRFNKEKIIPLTLFFILCTLLGIGLEIYGVREGLLFGDYVYGKTLGWTIFEVPVVIGVNWFLIIMCVDHLSKKVSKYKIIQIIVGALLAVGLDVLIEPIAIRLDYWSWAEGTIPFQNYLGWFICSVVLLTLLKFFKLKNDHSYPSLLFFLQVLFFSFLNLLI